jgi:hypothetical protein
MAINKDLSSTHQPTPRPRLTSSKRLGRIFFRLNRSENVGRTLTSPLRKVAFSSLGFEANVVGSRKLRVLIASEEKNWCEGRDLIEIRWFGCLVNNRGRRSGRQPCLDDVVSPLTSELHRSHFDPLAHDLDTSGPSAFSLRLDIDPRFWKGGFPPMCSAKRTHPREYRSDAGVRLESRAYSGAVVS